MDLMFKVLVDGRNAGLSRSFATPQSSSFGFKVFIPRALIGEVILNTKFIRLCFCFAALALGLLDCARAAGKSIEEQFDALPPFHFDQGEGADTPFPVTTGLPLQSHCRAAARNRKSP